MSSPPRSPPLPRRDSSPPISRKQSLVERTSAAIENAFSRKTSNPGSLAASSQSLTALVVPEEPSYSMNPDDYELGPVIGEFISPFVELI